MAQTKTNGIRKAHGCQSTFDLKQKIILALNKIGDRDTCHMGVDELERIAGTLIPQEVPPFLSVVLDTEKEHKSALRRECVRSLGVMAMRQEPNVMNAHVGKIVSSIVKRLKDPDTIVRDACVETIGILASRLSSGEGSSDSVFVSLVRPLFESLCEQSKHIQWGSALCLARIIDNVEHPPIAILQRMLTKTMKMLRTPHFMAKPAVIELNKIIIQSGGAQSKNNLSSALSSIQEALKETDWITRKAASVALGELASSGAMSLTIFKSSCIRSLEACRFDKVKPVRETVLHSIQCWKALSCSEKSEPSETGSSTKGLNHDYHFEENFRIGKAEYSEASSITKDVKEQTNNEQLSKKTQDRRASMDSTLTEISSVNLTNEIVHMRQKLLEIEAKQSNIIEMLHALTCGVMEALAHLQSPACTPRASLSQAGLSHVSTTWQRVRGCLSKGEIDSAYVEAIRSGDDGVMMQLVKRTGPVLESLSPTTIRDTLVVMLTRKILKSFCATWIQQLVELSEMHGGDCVGLTAKAKREVLTALETMELSVLEKRSFFKLAMELRLLWGRSGV